MGKNGIPMELQVLDGNKNRRSKEVIEFRLEHEKKMIFGNKEYKPTEKILENKVSIAKWNELVQLYKDIDFVSNVDIGAIEKYCIIYAEYYQLLEVKKEIETRCVDIVAACRAISEINLDSKINKKMDMLIKLEDRLFLNPVSRLKNVPKKPEKKEQSYLESVGLGMV